MCVCVCVCLRSQQFPTQLFSAMPKSVCYGNATIIIMSWAKATIDTIDRDTTQHCSDRSTSSWNDNPDHSLHLFLSSANKIHTLFYCGHSAGCFLTLSASSRSIWFVTIDNHECDNLLLWLFMIYVQLSNYIFPVPEPHVSVRWLTLADLLSFPQTFHLSSFTEFGSFVYQLLRDSIKLFKCCVNSQ